MALEVMKAHLIESREIINTSLKDFQSAILVAQGDPQFQWRFDGTTKVVKGEPQKGEVKVIEIEAEPEAVQNKEGLENFRLEETLSADLKSLDTIFKTLVELTTITRITPNDQDII